MGLHTTLRSCEITKRFSVSRFTRHGSMRVNFSMCSRPFSFLGKAEHSVIPSMEYVGRTPPDTKCLIRSAPSVERPSEPPVLPWTSHLVSSARPTSNSFRIETESWCPAPKLEPIPASLVSLHATLAGQARVTRKSIFKTSQLPKYLEDLLQ
jgi:hypothetical protein